MNKAIKLVAGFVLLVSVGGCHDRHGSVRIEDGMTHITWGILSFECDGSPSFLLPDAIEENFDEICSGATAGANMCSTKRGAFGVTFKPDPEDEDAEVVDEVKVKCDTGSVH
ncbi:MAG: hypothetical protein OXH68_20985 [Gammaproteobacteria bacterium]|nr:hypothetical protein [Gammaproteobacteria bacterium]